MLSLRERRAERSRKAYKTRMKRKNANKSDILKGIDCDDMVEVEAWESSSTHATHRVEMALNANRNPNADDIQLMMNAKRLSRRRDIYIRIIRERFELTGKCISEESSDDYYYPTHCSIWLLGDFISRKLIQMEASSQNTTL